MKVIDLAQAMAPDSQLKNVGIRPGEKIHEVMITREDAKHTVEYDKYFVVKPAFNLSVIDEKYSLGKPVAKSFEYHSGNNLEWLNIPQMKEMINEL